MDYSKLTPEQLLKLLKTQSPEMYGALTEPINAPGAWYDGKDPMDYYGDSMSDVLSRGYDPNLIVNKALSGSNLFDDNDQNRILFELDRLGTDLEHLDEDSNIFPSDGVNQEYASLFNENHPAYDSARYFDGVSDEDLLKLLLKKKA